MSTLRGGAFSALAICLVSGLAACASSSGTSGTSPATSAPTTTTTAPTNLAVTRITETFVDRTRATVDPDHTRSAPTCTFATDIYIPAGTGPYPLIVHAHGAAGDPRKFAVLARSWARHGYVVAIPTFPLTSDTSGGPTVIGDYTNQPADLHVVLDRVLQLARTTNSPLAGKIDPHHIGLSGLSLGGATAYGFGFNTCCRDPRIDAVIIMSGILVPFGSDPYVFDKPILIFHGTADPVIPFARGTAAYALAKPPKYFVTLVGAGHAPQYEGTPDPHDGIVIATTLDFWNLYLKGQRAARSQLLADADQAPLSRVQSAP